MPPSAASSSPGRAASAPVKAPRAWPKNSDSSRPSGIAAQFTATSARVRRGLRSWRKRARSSFPEPVSPSISTGTSKRATRSASASSARIGAERATMPAAAAPLPLFADDRTVLRLEPLQNRAADLGDVPFIESAVRRPVTNRDSEGPLSGGDPGRRIPGRRFPDRRLAEPVVVENPRLPPPGDAGAPRARGPAPALRGRSGRRSPRPPPGGAAAAPRPSAR